VNDQGESATRQTDREGGKEGGRERASERARERERARARERERCLLVLNFVKLAVPTTLIGTQFLVMGTQFIDISFTNNASWYTI
jgi:hypothetical protein